MKSTKEIVKPFKKFLKNLNYKKIDNGGLNPTIYLFQKWGYRVEKNYYGFDLGNVPFRWAQIIDDFLIELEKAAPNFKIQQIKLKYGKLKFYVDLVDFSDSKKCTIINNQIDELEKVLFHKDLIY
ncbi:MAG: hypothetical protein Q7R95_06070 [bacterium]|nr:hypothetical protein [bacterium]